jgi:hypothetical protein
VAALPPADLSTGADRAVTDQDIYSLEELWTTDSVDSLAGRRARIADARVLSVNGDKLFWVGESADRRMLVAVEEQPTPNEPDVEGRYDVKQGQTMTIYGTVERFPEVEEFQQRWGADPKLRDELENQRVYLRAHRLEITDRP